MILRVPPPVSPVPFHSFEKSMLASEPSTPKRFTPNVMAAALRSLSTAENVVAARAAKGDRLPA